MFAAFVSDLRRIAATDPQHHPAAAIEAILKGGYPATLRQKYDRPDNRIADIEQFAVLAARSESLEQLLAELLLAGDVYGMDSLAAPEPGEVLVLSTVHQAKGLEWSHVYVIRLIEEGFPHRRAIDEPGGEEEERRIFYVAVSRAMNELFLSYPSTITRGGSGPLVLTAPSRFLTELDDSLYERVVLEHELRPPRRRRRGRGFREVCSCPGHEFTGPIPEVTRAAEDSWHGGAMHLRPPGGRPGIPCYSVSRTIPPGKHARKLPGQHEHTPDLPPKELPRRRDGHVRVQFV